MQNIPGWAVFLAVLLVIEVLVLFFVLILLGLKLLRRKPGPAPASVAATPQQAPVAAVPSQAIPNRSQLIAAVVAAIAEYEGTDISSLRVVSFQQRRAA